MPVSSPSVLIIRLDAVGDALALTPMLAAFYAHSIPVDVVLRAENADIFAGRALRQAIVAQSAIEQLGPALRERHYSHVFVVTEDPAGYRLAGATRAPLRIGFTNLFGKPFKTLWALRFINRLVYRSAGLDRRAPHECEVLFRLSSSLLGDAEPTRDPSALRPMLLDTENIPADERIAVQITDKWERLGIAFSDVVELVSRLRGFGGVRGLASAKEDAYAARVATATGLAIDRFEQLQPWKEAIGAARAIVAPDSGALHVAGMLGTPVVGIFPPQRDFALQVARWSPWAAVHRIVRTDPGWPKKASDALAQLI
jgi:ADP-heptose:LPS heptosyltransferase